MTSAIAARATAISSVCQYLPRIVEVVLTRASRAIGKVAAAANHFGWGHFSSEWKLSSFTQTQVTKP